MAVFVFGSGVTSGVTSGGGSGGGGVLPSPVKSTFADNTWEEIIQACQENTVPDTWLIGDTKPMTINGVDYEIGIIGKNHDVYSDGTGTAPITFEMHELYGTEYQFHYSATTAMGWGGSDMRKIHLPSILPLMPTAVQTAIREVNKVTSLTSTEIETTADKLFLLSEGEVLGVKARARVMEGVQYEYYANGATRQKVKAGKVDEWFLRSPVASSSYRVVCVASTGTVTINEVTSVSPITFAFCF